MSDYSRQRVMLRVWQFLLLVALIALWWGVVTIWPQSKMFFGKPLEVLARLQRWFWVDGLGGHIMNGTLGAVIEDGSLVRQIMNRSIYGHLMITLVETVLAFVLGVAGGLFVGLWLGLSRYASEVLSPFITAANSMPRVILAPIFGMWFGLGIWSKVALAFTLVFFIVFFNVYRGIREVNPVLLNNARMLGASRSQLLKSVYLPSATSWVFSSLHTSVGMAFVGAVVGEYLGSAKGVGYLILQAEGSFDMSTVVAGILVLTMCALLLDYFVTFFERHYLKWQPTSGSGSSI